jgi:hypothetical protein
MPEFNDNEKNLSCVLHRPSSCYCCGTFLITLFENEFRSLQFQLREANSLDFCHLINSIILDLANLITIMLVMERESEVNARENNSNIEKSCSVPDAVVKHERSRRDEDGKSSERSS